jgi:hypothetical protein
LPAAPPPTAPLPTAGLAGQQVGVLPLTLIAAADSLHWDEELADRQAALATADSLIGSLLAARAPEVVWVLPGELRSAARRSAGVAPDPRRMGSSILRAERMIEVPDPLRTQLRRLVALAGGRYALIPAALVYLPAPAPAGSGPPSTPLRAGAELSIVLVDARMGRVQWRTVARGEGGGPWDALTQAVKALTPGLP